MAEVINGYHLLKPMTNENAGFAKWGRAVKGDEEFFVKEFLDPCYPMSDSPFDEHTKASIQEACVRWENEKRHLYAGVNEASDGNIVRIREFFRWNGRYYIATQWVETALHSDFWQTAARSKDDESRLSVADISAFEWEDRIRCCLALSHSMKCLHSAGIVHADIKPKNIILTRNAQSGSLSAKIIDIDSGFFVGNPPDALVGDQLYLAPESVLLIIQGPERSPVRCEADVFAMGLIFHEALTGELPALPKGYSFACEACLNGKAPKVSKQVNRDVRQLIEKMLAPDACERPSMATVHSELWRHLHGSSSVVPAEASERAKGPPKALTDDPGKTAPQPTKRSHGTTPPQTEKSRLLISPALLGEPASADGAHAPAEAEARMSESFRKAGNL